MFPSSAQNKHRVLLGEKLLLLLCRKCDKLRIERKIHETESFDHCENKERRKKKEEAAFLGKVFSSFPSLPSPSSRSDNKKTTTTITTTTKTKKHDSSGQPGPKPLQSVHAPIDLRKRVIAVVGVVAVVVVVFLLVFFFFFFFFFLLVFLCVGVVVGCC